MAVYPINAEIAWPAKGTYFAACLIVSRMPMTRAARSTRSRVIILPISIEPTAATAL